MPGQTSTVKKATRGLARFAQTPTADDGPRPGTAPRTVRPRHLHVNDKIRIVVGTDDPEVASLDGGAFREWLQRQQEEEAQQGSSSTLQPRVAVIGHTFKPIPAVLEAPELSSLAKSLAAVRQEAAQAIATPSFVNIQSSLVQDIAAGGKSAYIRYVVPTPDDEEATVEYDLDEEDEEWLQQHNCQVKQKLSEDEMEQLMDALEKMHHAELQKHPERWANLIGSPMPAKDSKGKGKSTISDGLQLPDVDTVLPLQTALQGLRSQPPAAVKLVYLHWCQKRQYSERPLLQRLWYEPPWHRLTVAGSKGKATAEGECEEDVPFMAQEERRPLYRVRKTMQLHDVDSRLRDMRDDLEQVRILADQCRRREKLRKRALATWQQDMYALLQHAIALDQQMLDPLAPSSSAKQLSASKIPKHMSTKKQPSSKQGGHGKATSSKQGLQLAAEIADATENAQTKFEHDMRLSLQLTNSVADEAAKLHHVKIVRASSSQLGSADVAGPSEQPTQNDKGDAGAQQQSGVASKPHDNASVETADDQQAGALLAASPCRLTRSMQAPGIAQTAVPGSSLVPASADSGDIQAEAAPAATEQTQSPCRVTRSMQGQGTPAADAPSTTHAIVLAESDTAETDEAAAHQPSLSSLRVTRSTPALAMPAGEDEAPGSSHTVGHAAEEPRGQSARLMTPAGPSQHDAVTGQPSHSHGAIGQPRRQSNRLTPVVSSHRVTDMPSSSQGAVGESERQSNRLKPAASSHTVTDMPSSSHGAVDEPRRQSARLTPARPLQLDMVADLPSSSCGAVGEPRRQSDPAGPTQQPGPDGGNQSAVALSSLRLTRSAQLLRSQGTISTAKSSSSQHPGNPADSLSDRHPVSSPSSPPSQRPVSSVQLTPRLFPNSAVQEPVPEENTLQEGQLQISPRQTRSHRAVASIVEQAASADDGAEDSASDSPEPERQRLQSQTSDSQIAGLPEPEQQVLDVASTRSLAKGSHHAPALQGSNKKARQASAGKAVRFSDSNATAVQTGSAVSPSAEMHTETVTRTTRSGRPLGLAATTPAAKASPVDEPQDILHTYKAQAATGVSTTRSGRVFAEKQDSYLPATVCADPAEEAGGLPSALPSPAPFSDPEHASRQPRTSAVAEAASDPAAEAGEVSQPWGASLLGMGLSLALPEETRWLDGGRPSIDHPRHKSKSASMMRRTLSPPLSSPRPPAHQPALSFAPDPHQDLPGPSQLPSQLPQLQHQIPSSQATNNKTMVDCGCDPIVFSEDSESEQEQEDEGLDNKSQRGKGVQISKGVKRHAARQETTSKGQKSAPTETPSKVTHRLTSQTGIDSQQAVASTPVVDTTRPVSTGLLSAVQVTPAAAAQPAATSADRRITRGSAASAAASAIPAAATGTKAAAMSVGKPPLPPTACKALTGHRAAQKATSVGANKGSLGRSPNALTHLPAAAEAAKLLIGVDPDRPVTRQSKQQVASASSGAEAAAEAAAFVDSDRPVTRHLQRHMTDSSNSSAAPAETATVSDTHGDDVVPPKTRSRSKSLGASTVVGSQPKSPAKVQAAPADVGSFVAERAVPVTRKRKAEAETSPLASHGTEAGKPAVLGKQAGKANDSSSARQAANRITKGLVRSVSRHSSVATAPAQRALPQGHEPAGAPQHVNVAKGKADTFTVIPAAVAASPAAGAAALESASASGQVGCPKCRYAKYGCRKCRIAYVKKTGTPIPVDRSLHAAAFALLQTPSGSSQAAAKSSQPAAASIQQLPKSSQPDAGSSQRPAAPAQQQSSSAAQVRDNSMGSEAQGRLGKGSTAAHSQSAKRPASSSQQPVAKKQKTSQAAAQHVSAAKQTQPSISQPAVTAKQFKPDAAAKHASDGKQRHPSVSKPVLAGSAKAVSNSSLSSAQASKLHAASMRKSSDAMPSQPLEASGRGTKRARSGSSPAPGQGHTDRTVSAAKRSRLSETVTAAGAAMGTQTAKAKSSRASTPSAAAPHTARPKPSQKASKQTFAAADAPSTVKPSKATKQTHASATTQERASKGTQSTKLQSTSQKPLKLALAKKQSPGGKQQTAAKVSSVAKLSKATTTSSVKPSKVGKPHAVATPESAAAKAATGASLTQTAPKGSALIVPTQAAVKRTTITAAGKSPAPAVPKQTAASKGTKQVPLPKSDLKAALVPAKTNNRSVAAPHALTAVKLNRTASGRAATAAGHAVAEALESKLGCSKCRFVPTGCKKCRAKQAGQLSLAAADKA